MSVPPPELIRLLSVLLDGKLSDSERQQLNDLVRDDKSAQLLYREVISLHALLYLDFGQGYRNLVPSLIGREPPPVTNMPSTNYADSVESDDDLLSLVSSNANDFESRYTGNTRRRQRVAPLLAVLSASVAIAIAGVWWSISRRSVEGERITVRSESSPAKGRDRASPDERAARSVAVLGQAAGAAWSAASLVPNVGGGLRAGKFHLDSGLIQLEFLSGAAVVIDGPAAFELVSSDRLICYRGKYRARVPAQAHGFRIETPTIAAVDLGTEFTVNVGGDGQSDFHVLEGEVELWDLRSKGKSPLETLTTGLSARATADGKLSKLSFEQHPVVGSRQLLELSERADQKRFAEWRRFSEVTRSRPDVLVYYGFNRHDPWDRELRNEGSNSSEKLTGAIVGCQWTTGRWPGKHALEFKRVTDRVRLNVEGEFESLTYSAWVRIEGLERWLSSLMLTDGHDPEEVHWQITEHGGLLLGVNDSEGNLHDYFSPTVLGSTDLGRWVHLATVYDRSRGVVRHYLDGKQLSSEKIVSPTKLRIGKAEIGNWAPNDRTGFRTRSLNGRIDEFILFSRPLSSDEIREIYQAGKPDS